MYYLLKDPSPREKSVILNLPENAGKCRAVLCSLPYIAEWPIANFAWQSVEPFLVCDRGGVLHSEHGSPRKPWICQMVSGAEQARQRRDYLLAVIAARPTTTGGVYPPVFCDKRSKRWS